MIPNVTAVSVGTPSKASQWREHLVRLTPITEALAGLTSLASIDDVILYLRRHGDVALAETESADELLARANLKRAEHGLPPFALFPTAPQGAAQQDKVKNVTAPRPAVPPPLNARARAALAQRLISLPADEAAAL